MDSHILLSYIPRELFSFHDKHHHPAVEFYQGEHVIDLIIVLIADQYGLKRSLLGPDFSFPDKHFHLIFNITIIQWTPTKISLYLE